MFVFYNTINLNVQKETFHENLFDIKFCSFAILQHFEQDLAKQRMKAERRGEQRSNLSQSLLNNSQNHLDVSTPATTRHCALKIYPVTSNY